MNGRPPGAPAPAAQPGSSARRIVSNAGWLLLSDLAVRAIAFVAGVYLARQLGASLYGVVGIAVALMAFLGNLVRVGTTQPAIRELARAPERTAQTYARVAGLRLAMALVLAAVVLPGLGPLSRSLSAPPELVALYLLGLLPVALTAVWTFQGLERMSVVAAGRVAQQLAVLFGWLLLVREGGHLLRVPLVELGAALAAVGFFAWRLRALHGPLGIRFDVRAWPSMLAESLPLALAVLFRMVYSRGDVVLLGWLGSAHGAGLFLVSHKLVLAASTLPVLLQQAAFPATSRLLHRDPRSALALQAGLARHALVLLVPVVLVGVAFAREILVALFGEGYAEAAPVLRTTLFTVPVLVVTAGMRNVLVAATAPRPLLIGTALSVVAHVGLALPLIPRFGAAGAAWACLLGEAAGAALLHELARRRLGGTPFRGRTLAPLLAGAVAALPLATLPAAPGLALAAALYGAGVVALGALRPDEIRGALAYARELRGRLGGR